MLVKVDPQAGFAIEVELGTAGVVTVHGAPYALKNPLDLTETSIV
jgi:hypothetical protein